MPLPPMRALVRDHDRLALVERPAPRVEGADDDVIVAVAYGGVCRTDLAVADGALGARPVVIGHEVAGTVAACGPAARLAIGAPVAVVPVQPCGGCDGCAAARGCGAPRWLGVDRDGGFATYVRVPAACAIPLPRELPLVRAVYVEPVAAAMGVLRAGIERGARVVIGGDNRIAELTARVVAAHGVTDVVRWRGDGPAPAADVAIESGPEGIAALAAAVRPGGTLILKSRGAATVALDVGGLVAREVTVRALGHAPFAAAIDWLHRGRIVVDDLLAAPRPLDAWPEVLAAARASEAVKPVLAIGAA